MARRVPFRVAGLRLCAPTSGRNDGPNGLLRPPGAEVVPGPVRDPAGQQRVGPGFPQGSGLGAVEVRAARHAQAQRTALSIRQDEDQGAEAAPAAVESGLRLFGLGRARERSGRARPYCPAARAARSGSPCRGRQARPDTLVTPVGLAAIDRVPLFALGGPLMPGRARPWLAGSWLWLHSKSNAT